MAFIKSTAILAAAASLFSQVAAHGYIRNVQIGGNYYEGFKESTWENKADGSPILITSYLVPLYDVWSSQIACGLNPKAPQAHAPVSPGDSVGWKWNTHDDMPWTHTMGTHRTFIGACNGDCANISPNDVQWMELGGDLTGQQNYDSGSGNWPVQVLHDGGMWYDKIPNVPAGKYLLRNELTALHYSWKTTDKNDDGHPWGTEFYPSCMAIEVSGGDGSFNPGNTWKFPGSYQADEAGHYNPDIMQNPGGTIMAALSNGQSYSAPAPSSGGNTSNNSGNNSNNNSGNNSANNTPAAAETPASSSTSSAASSTSTSKPQVCKRGTRRELAARANKMRRSHLVHRRTEH